MNKAGTFLAVLLISPLIAAAYGALHDQVTYSISPEYYTKFKFISFAVPESSWDRLGAAMVGLKASWWTGIPVGIIIATAGLIHREAKEMLQVSLQSLGVVILTALLFGFAGYLYGKYSLSLHPQEYFSGWVIPADLSDYPSYITVGTIHNFSYLGGAAGIFTGTAWQVIQKNRRKKRNS